MKRLKEFKANRCTSFIPSILISRTFLLWLWFFIYGTALTLYARESPYTLQGTGPRYWIAYENCWTENKAITEDRWKSNIDWVNDNFKSFGYDMVCTDGWIENAQTINANGYITKYNDLWVNGFDYWAKYLARQNMKLGVYYNPMWLTRTALAENVPVVGTGYHAPDIVGETPFNIDLNWVDTDKPGAREWIQGYVKYFIDQGATYLRIDFLENYEKNYGTKRYAQALEWIKEAAGNKIFLSLVMPNCYNHAQTELAYGDMIRIDDDCFDGGWDFLSNRRRGQSKPDWPQYGNAFDGFISFSDISGKGKIILDGDFIRLNTLDTDAERIFQVSLFAMAGSPLCIADQYDTADSCARFYQNRDILELNDQGFVGKPLSHNMKDTINSSIWVGQMPNGDWVIGLFNREETPQIRSIDFVKDLGIQKGSIQDIKELWTQARLNNNSQSISEVIPPHSCKIWRIFCNVPLRTKA